MSADIKELIERLKSNDGPVGNLQDEAADALETLSRQLEEKEAEIEGWREDQKENMRIAVDLHNQLAAANAEIERLNAENLRITRQSAKRLIGLCSSGEKREQLEKQLAAANSKIDGLKLQLDDYKDDRREGFNRVFEAMKDDPNNPYDRKWSTIVLHIEDQEQKIAAAQATNEQLREALETYISEHEECQDADDWMAMMCSIEAHHVADEALSLPNDTTALLEYGKRVAEKTREMCANKAKWFSPYVARKIHALDVSKVLEEE